MLAQSVDAPVTPALLDAGNLAVERVERAIVLIDHSLAAFPLQRDHLVRFPPQRASFGFHLATPQPMRFDGLSFEVPEVSLPSNERWLHLGASPTSASTSTLTPGLRAA